MFALLWACVGAGEPEADGRDHGHGEHADEVVLGETALANARLRVEALAPTALDAATTVPARIALDPRREARISAVTAGTLERILVRPGDPVTENQPLGTVLSPDLGAAIGDHLAASAREQAARARRDRISGLRDAGFSSVAELAQAEADLTVAAAEAEAAEERLRVFGVSPARASPGEHFSSRFSVRSPIAGEVLAIEASIGASVASGEALFHVGNVDEVWLILDVYERSLPSIAVGAPVSFTADAWGDERFTGTVDQIGSWLDPTSRTLEVRVVVPNPDHRLKPNMFAKARLSLGSAGGGEGLVVAPDAVQDVEGAPSVFVELEAGRFRVARITSEPLPDGRLRLLDGVVAGDRVVVEGAFTLRSELAKGELGGHHDH